MKVVTSKEFQLRQSRVMREVAAGAHYRVTFHGKPWVELRPIGRANVRPKRGTIEAFRASLGIVLDSSSLPASPDYKALRRTQLAHSPLI